MESTLPLAQLPTIALPQRSLIVLCGPAGSGKSTFAQNFVETRQDLGCKPTTIVSSDHCRAMICDDETNQQANRDAFDLFYSIIRKRLLQGRLTIADSTALQASARLRLLELAGNYQYQTLLFIFDVPLHTCLARDLERHGRTVGSQVITYHWQLLQQALMAIPHEGWGQIASISDDLNLGFNPECDGFGR